GGNVWRSRFAWSAHTGDEAFALAVSPAGTRVFVTGNASTRVGLGRGATVAYDAATGGLTWRASLQGFHSGYTNGAAVGVSPDGTMVYVDRQASGRAGQR